jgi:protein-disulfide isomerase
MSTPTKAQRRAEARAAREAAERAERERAARRRRLTILGGVLALAAVVLVAAIALSSSGSDDEAGERASSVAPVSLAGIPQDGLVLGDADAPVTVQEFVDLQCPVCAEFSEQALPDLVEEYVRPGRVRLELRPLAFIGEDSVRGARAAVAAAQQDRAWPFVERFYARQGGENTGYATDAFLREVAAGVPGLDVDRLLADRDSDAVTRELERAQADADRLGVEGTPSFAVGPTGGEAELVQLTSIGIDDLRGPIEEAAR